LASIHKGTIYFEGHDPLAFLSPEDYERIGHLEGGIEAAKTDIANYTAANPPAEHPGDSAGAQAIAEWKTQTEAIETALATKNAYLQRLQQELKSIG
jgi:hypothetical protein